MQSHCDAMRREGKAIAFVPTMGFLHEGHLSLMREGRRLGDHLAASIFVNPAQFGANEDLASYPRDLARDLDLCEQVGVDVVFTPHPEEIYPPGYLTYVEVEEIPDHLCGLSRPGHFRGVSTVVAKLFNIVMPHVAVFGEKDYQQLAVIRRMTTDLNFPVRVVGGPTVREEDGLAMSSRNAYLTPGQRAFAPTLFQVLMEARDKVEAGETDAGAILEPARERLEAHEESRVDYATICDPNTLDDVERIQGPVLMALAVYVGDTRLIDNMILAPKT